MKTPRRNKAAAVVFFVLVGLVGGMFGSIWLARSAINLSDLGVFVVSLFWGAMAMVCSVHLYRELEHRAEEKRVDADLKRLHAMWDATMRENGYRP